MANNKEHAVVGAFVGGTTAVINWDLSVPDEQKNYWNFLEHLGIGILVGDLTSRLPDLLEPATSPNHRSIAHSMAAAVSLLYIVFQLSKRPGTDPLLKTIGLSAIAGYLSHQALDATTPKGLPFIT